MTRPSFPLVLAVTPFAFCTPVQAEMQKSFTVGADIANGCAVALLAGGNWGRIDLGSYPGTNIGSVDANLLAGAAGGLQIECTPGTALSVSADTGDHVSGGVRQLERTGGSERIAYQLFADGSTTPWTTQAVALSFPTGAAVRAFPVHARATLTGTHSAGTYTDQVRVTVSW